MQDSEIVEQIRQGDNGAYQHLVERHSRVLFRLAYRITGNSTDAEDVVQETFLRAYRKLDSFDARASFATWVQRIAANYSLDLLRSRKRQVDQRRIDGSEDFPQVADQAPQPDRLLLNSQLRDSLDNGLRALTEQERSAFVLRHYEGQSISEISATLDIGESAAKQSVFRAVRKLRSFLEPAFGVTS
jgi:RNA polymerase sigma-70 factor, ECF subfamily